MRTWTVLLLSLALLAACKPGTQAPGAAPAATPETPEPGTAKPATAKPEGAKAVDRASPSERPALRIATINGKTFDLAEQRGKWVVVNFWATWCGPCLKEMPELSALDAMREHIVVVGLAYEEIEVEAMRAFMQKRPVVYPIAILDVYNPPADFDTPRGLPTTYLLAPDGKVAKKYTGPVSARMIEEDIAAAGGPKVG